MKIGYKAFSYDQHFQSRTWKQHPWKLRDVQDLSEQHQVATSRFSLP